MTLPYDVSRCAGLTNWREKPSGTPDKLQPQCNDCRRREPGHPDRQVYLAPHLDELMQCIHRIGPKR